MLERMNPVAITGLLVAAIRAEESKRDDRLFEDPFAAALAGKDGYDAFARYQSAAMPVPIIEVRTRWYDDSLGRLGAGDRTQFVILAAGMDSRAYRLNWPAGAAVFEVDQASVLAHKRIDAEPRCRRVVVPADLAGDWSTSLIGAGFAPTKPTVWTVEGVLQYLPETAVKSLFQKVSALSAAGSVVLYDVVGASLLAAPFMTPMLTMMKDLGAPWIYGSDTPGDLLPGWSVKDVEPGVLGTSLQRWPFPVREGGPRGWFLEATK